MKEGGKKTILVTGGAGFIGSHLVRELVKEGHIVISLDNYFTGSKDNHVLGAEYRSGHTKNIDKLIPEQIDLIYHFGEYSRVNKSLEEPEVVWDLNVIGTSSVLEFWRKQKCKLIYAGSSTKFTPPRVDGVLGRNLSPYTWAKAVNSELVVNYGTWYDLQYAVVYFFSVYGEGERAGVNNYGTVVATFREQYLRAPGTQRRAFTHVLDTVDGIMLVGEKGRGDEYGICADETYSLLELAEMFGGEVEILPATKTSRSSEAIDSAKIKALGWKQKRTLAGYIKEITEK
jgi:UDP-glucose 4-epimerase